MSLGNRLGRDIHMMLANVSSILRSMLSNVFFASYAAYVAYAVTVELVSKQLL